MRGLKDRTVIVTGGANGIGAAIARRLADEGCAVGILDMDAAAGEKVAGEIKVGGGQASFHAVDITDYDAVARAVETFELALRAGRLSRQQRRMGSRRNIPRHARRTSGARSSTSICSGRSTSTTWCCAAWPSAGSVAS